MDSNVDGRVDREERDMEGRGRRRRGGGGERETIAATLSEEEAAAEAGDDDEDDDEDDDDDEEEEEEEEDEGAGGGTNDEERKLLDELEGLEEAEEEEYSGPLLAEDEEEDDDDVDDDGDGEGEGEGDEDEDEDEGEQGGGSDRMRRIEEENMRRRGIDEENVKRGGVEEEEEEEANGRGVGEGDEEEEEEEEDDYVDEDDNEEEVNGRKGAGKGEYVTRIVQVGERTRHNEEGEEDDVEECQDSEGADDDDDDDNDDDDDGGGGGGEEPEKERPSVLDFLKRPPELDAGTPEEQEEFSREVSRFLANRKMEYRPPRFYGTNLNMLQLWRTVIRLGAYDYVTANKLWRQVGETFNPPKKCTTVSWSFRGFYEKSLLDYERYMLRGTGYSTGRRGRFDVDESHAQNGLTQGRAKRDAALRAMQGWHSQKNIENEDGAHSLKEKVSTVATTRRDKQMDTPKRKNPSIPDQPVKAARLMNGTRSQFVGEPLKVENDDRGYPSFNEVQKRPSLKQSHIKPVPKSSSYHLANGVDVRVADEGPEADWVKINVHKTGDCFEVYALVPGLLQEELRIQCEPGGMLVIIGEPEQPNNPWGVTPFRKVIKLPSAIDANQTSAVITLHGQLFVRVPYGET